MLPLSRTPCHLGVYILVFYRQWLALCVWCFCMQVHFANSPSCTSLIDALIQTVAFQY